MNWHTFTIKVIWLKLRVFNQIVNAISHWSPQEQGVLFQWNFLIQFYFIKINLNHLLNVNIYVPDFIFFSKQCFEYISYLEANTNY